MFEIHGWITILEWKIPYEKAISILKHEIAEIKFEPLRMDLESLNGNVLNISGITNRDRGYVEEIKILIQKIQELADCPYGLIYYTTNDAGNEVFDVMVVRKNTVELKRDVWLSPLYLMTEE